MAAVILLDENIIVGQARLLRSLDVHCRHIGHDLEAQGIQDDNILPVLHRLRRPTLFTRDLRLYKRSLCHPNYCIVCLAVGEANVAPFARRILRHRAFDTAARRMGLIVHVGTKLIRTWRRHASEEAVTAWR